MSQIVAVKISDEKTAAEPRSFARPDNSCRSLPIRSTTVSIAELMSSTTTTSSQLPISKARSTLDRPSHKASGRASNEKQNS